jgi:sigma-E factor negative regulatory protein RseA
VSAPERAQADAREAMSALADGEFGHGPGAGPGGAPDLDLALDQALAQWRDDAGARQAWSTYHTIGDVLRSQELARHAGGDEAFLASLRTRLAQEPVVLAPDAGLTEAVRRSAAAQDSARRRAHWRAPAWLGASAAAAGVAAVAAVLWVVQGLEAEPGAPVLAQAPAGLPATPATPGTPAWQRGSALAVQPVAVQPLARAPAAAGVAPGPGAGALEDYLRVHQGSPRVPAPVKLEAEGWTLVRVPEGYELQGAVRRLAERAATGGTPASMPLPGAALPQQLQAVYRRGAQRVSVFIDPVSPGQPAEPLALRTGATTVLMVPHEQGAFVTVMGEVPLPTLQQFAGALKRHP